MKMDFTPMADRWCRASFSVAGTDSICRRDKGHTGGHSEVRQNADEDEALRDTPGISVINDAMAGVQDPEETPENRAAMYGLLYEIKRRIDRALGTYARGKATAKSELTEHLVRNGEELGPLYIAWEAFDVSWPVNEEGNWGDAGVQEQLSVFSLIAPEFIRHIPDHFEIATAALGEAVHAGDPVARQLHTEAKDRGWRTEGGRRAALKVREVKRKAA